MPDLVESLGYIKGNSSSSPRPIKTPSNSIRYNCYKICYWSRRGKTIPKMRIRPHFSRCSTSLFLQAFTNNRKTWSPWQPGDTGVQPKQFAIVTMLHTFMSKPFNFTSYLRLNLQESLLAVYHWWFFETFISLSLREKLKFVSNLCICYYEQKTKVDFDNLFDGFSLNQLIYHVNFIWLV